MWVRWCHAYAYCKWAGKRLCGKHGGGTYPWADSEASYNSQWSYACRGGIPGTQYPYGGGSAYTKDVCVGGEPTFTAVVPVDDPINGLHRAMLISEVEYSLDEGGTVATLTVAPPDAFEPEPQDPHKARKVKRGGKADNFEYLLPPDWESKQ